MEEIERKSFQGVLNIIRFNFHFYVLASVLVFLMLVIARYSNEGIQMFIAHLCVVIGIIIAISLLVSLYVYDLSGLYKFKWLNKNDEECLIVNINAGFDETSGLLKTKFRNAKLVVLDFYDEAKHTEISIKRARRYYPPSKETLKVQTTNLRLKTNSVDKIFINLSAHEIRDYNERINFFRELKRVIKIDGKIYITEHLRDLPNFLAYNIGFFHFYSKKTWSEIFTKAGLTIKKEIKNTLFVSTYILVNNGNSH